MWSRADRGRVQVLSHESAAALWGLPTRQRMDRHVTVARNCAHPVRGMRTHRADLHAEEVCHHDGVLVTDPLRTVTDCARTLPFGWGLAVADAALRKGLSAISTSGELPRAPAAGAPRSCDGWRDWRTVVPSPAWSR